MARFRFTLEPVLKSRREAERAQQRVVAEMETRRRELEDSLRGRQDAIDAGKRELGTRLVGALDMDGLRAQAGATILVMRRAHRVLLELAGVHERMERARRELVERARARRTIELLRERRFDEWRRAEGRREDAALDDLAGRRCREDS